MDPKQSNADETPDSTIRALESSERPPQARGNGSYLVALLVAAVSLIGILICSQVRSPIEFGIFQRPPLYGYWLPAIDWIALTVIPTAALTVVVSVLVVTERRVPTWVGVILLTISALALAAALGVARGNPDDLVRRISDSDQMVSYASDVDLVDKYGVRGFAQLHPTLADEFAYYNTRTHPPGPVLFIWALLESIGITHTLRVATGIAALGLSMAAGAAVIGRAYGTDRTGRIAAVLTVAAPGPLLLAFTSMDPVFATGMAFAAGMFVLSARRTSSWWAFGGGVILGLTTLMTFATAFVALAATITHMVVNDRERVIRKLGAAALGGLLVLVPATLGLGFDLIGSYFAVPGNSRSLDPYWIVGGPSAWLIMAGLPVAAFGTSGLFRKLRDGSRPVFAIVLVMLMVIWAALPPEATKLRPGEMERTWAFLYPVLAAVAALSVDRWMEDSGSRRSAVLAGLLTISIVQAFIIQISWDTLF